MITDAHVLSDACMSVAARQSEGKGARVCQADAMSLHLALTPPIIESASSFCDGGRGNEVNTDSGFSSGWKCIIHLTTSANR